MSIVLTNPSRKNDARVATIASIGAMTIGAAATIAFPVAPVATLLATAVAAYGADRAVRAAETRRRERLEMVAPRWSKVTVDELPTEDPDMIYLGEGYDWRTDECQLYHDAIAGRTLHPEDYRDALEHYGFWPANVPQGASEEAIARNKAKGEGGDPRIMGLGWARHRSVFVRKDLYAQHACIWGTTGSGKTRCIEGLIAWIARQGHGLLVVDPKGDGGLTNLCWGLARKHGRAWTWTALANPEESYRYNPVLGFKDPTVLLSRIKALIPESPDQPFWSDTPGVAAGTALIVQGWSYNLLRLLGSDGAKLSRMHLAVGVAANAARNRADKRVSAADITAAYAQVDAAARIDIPEFDPAYRLTAHGVAPSLQSLYRYAVDEPRSLLGLAAKLIHPHLFLGVEGDQLAVYEAKRSAGQPKDAPPYQANLEDIFGLRTPLEDGYDPDMTASVAPIEDGVTFAPEAISTLWSVFGDKRDEIAHCIKEIRENAVRIVLPWSRQQAEERKRFCSSLSTALAGFAGRWDVVSAPYSHLDVQRVADRGEIAYVALNTLAMGATADAFAKVLLADIAAYAGGINASGDPSTAKELWVIVDEIASIANTSLLRILQQARSAKVRFIALGQNRTALEKGLGDKGQVSDLLGNMTISAQLRAGTRDEAEEAVSSYPEVQIRRRSTNTGVSPAVGDAANELVSLMSGNIGQSAQIHDVKLVPAPLLQDLPQGVAVVNLDRTPHVIQYPMVVLAEQDRHDWMAQIHEPLPPEQVAMLDAAGLPAPEFHFRAEDRIAGRVRTPIAATGVMP